MEMKFLIDNIQTNIMILFLLNKHLTTFYHNTISLETLGKLEFQLDDRLTRRAASLQRKRGREGKIMFLKISPFHLILFKFCTK